MWTPYQQFARVHFPELCQERPVNSHKGTFGTVAIIGGNTGMSGAAIMAARAALKMGAGKVKIGFAQDSLPLPVLEAQPEIMLYTAQELLQHTDISAWSVGCGLNTNPRALQVMQQTQQRFQAETNSQVVWDADALNLFALHPDLQAAIQTQHIITPHPTEAARLLKMGTAEIQANRHAAVAQLCARFGCISVLKGHHSLVGSSRKCLCKPQWQCRSGNGWQWRYPIWIYDKFISARNSTSYSCTCGGLDSCCGC